MGAFSPSQRASVYKQIKPIMTQLEIYYFGFIACASLLAIVNYRLGLWLMFFAGLLGDPVRKLTPDNPLYITLSFAPIAIVSYFSMMFRRLKEKRLFHVYPYLQFPLFLFLICLTFSAFLAIVNRFPILAVLISFVQYLGIIVGVRVGYYLLRKEKDVFNMARIFVFTVSPFLFTVLLHFWGFQEKWPVLETMASEGKPYLQFHAGEALVMLNGVFRSPEVMGWYAMVTAICATFLIARGRQISFGKALNLLIVLNSIVFILMSGRRKMFMGLVVFAFIFIALLARKNLKRMVSSLVILTIISVLGFFYLKRQGDISLYLASAQSSAAAVGERMETGVIGSMVGTIKLTGFFGKGLGAATQGARHVQKDESSDLMIEAGTGKFLSELGIPGFFATCVLLWAFLWSCYNILLYEVRGEKTSLTSSFLFSIAIVHIISFAISYQVYADPMIGFLTGVMLGMLLATPKFEKVLSFRRN